MKKYVSGLLIPLVVLQAEAKPAPKKPTKAAAPAAAQAAKKTTVGDLLKTADRGAGQRMEEKKATALPTFSQSLFDQTQKSANPVNFSDIKPPRSSSFFTDPNDDKAKLEQISDQQINELYKLTQRYRNSPTRGELWLRLAELYSEKAGLIDFRKQGEYDVKLKAFQEGKTKVKPVLDLRDAKEYNTKAIQLYEWFIRDFPKDPKMDQALYFLGYNYFELGDTSKGTVYYTRLTKEYPRSPYIVESNFALGEYYFENEKWRQALEYYLTVLKHPRHRLYGFSMYKAAWCYFRGGDSRKALLTMETLIRQSRESQAAADRDKKQVSRVKLEGEGLRDIVLFYSEVGDPARAPSYFQALVGGKDANNYLEKLAYFYADKGNREGARILFTHLIQQNPNAAKAFDYKYQIVKVYSNANKTREFREELYSWVKDFGASSSWAAANKAKPEVIANSDKLREQTLRTWILQQHQSAQNSRAPFSQSLALEGYKLYMSEFAQSPVLADMHFYYGELLYDMNRFEEAGIQYRWVAENGAGSKFHTKAAENMVLALERNIPKDDEIAKRVGKSVEPIPFDAKVEKFIQGGSWFVEKFPNAEKTPEVKFRLGRLYYQHNQFDKAIPYFRDIIQKYPKTKYAEYSANLLLDIYNLKKDYVGLEKTGQELLAIPAIANSEAGKDIRGVVEQASFKKAQDLEIAKDYGKSAETFERFAHDNPKSELASTAQFNAAINYERAGNSGKAIQMHGLVLRSPDKKVEAMKPKSRRILAKLYQDTGQLDEASKAYRAAADEAGKDPIALNLLFNAAVLDEALGKNQSATANYESYFQKSKKRDRFEALYSMATMNRRAGKNSSAADKYKDYVNSGAGTQEKNVESAFWLYKLSQKMGRTKDAEEWRRKTLGLQSRYSPEKKGTGATYAAQIKMEDAQATFREFKSISMNNVRKLKEQSDKKIALLTKLNKELAEIIKYDSPDEIVSALSLLGQANLHLGEAFVNSPVPTELKSQEEIGQYKAGVQKLADPFFVKAKESLKSAVDRGIEFEAYTHEYKIARELLAKLDNKIYYENGEVGSSFRQSNWMGL